MLYVVIVIPVLLICRQLSSPGKPKTALNGSLTASPQSETSVVTVKVTNLSKSVTKQDLKGRLQYSTECSFKPKDISSVCLKVADVRSLNHAFVVCSSRAVAERVVIFLHDREIKGNKVTAKVHEPQNGKGTCVIPSCYIMYNLCVMHVSRCKGPCQELLKGFNYSPFILAVFLLKIPKALKVAIFT